VANQTPDEFIQLVTQNQSLLYAFVLSLVGHTGQAEDILQETNLVLWKKASEFELGTEFNSWMFKIAHMQVMAYRQRRNREKILFDSTMIPEMAAEASAHLSEFDARQHALQACLEKLSPRQRDMVRRRYRPGATLQQISTELGDSTAAIKQILFRTRMALLECVKRTLASEHGT